MASALAAVAAHHHHHHHRRRRRHHIRMPKQWELIVMRKLATSNNHITR
jgi:hypothetical protein